MSISMAPPHYDVVLSLNKVQELPRPLYVFFLDLCVFEGSWAIAEAQTICQEEDAGAYCEVLARQGLLERHAFPVKRNTRFSVQPDLRHVLFSRLSTERRDDLEKRYQACYFTLALQASYFLVHTPSPLWLTRLDAEQENLEAVFRLPQTDTLTMAVALWRWSLYRERYAKGIWYLEYAINSNSDRELELCAAYLALGALHRRLGNVKHGERFLKCAVSSAAPAARKDVLSNALRELGTMASNKGSFIEAHQYLKCALMMFRQMGDAWSEAQVRNEIGIALWRLGKYEEAYSQFRQAFVTFKSHEDSLQGASVLNNMAAMAEERHEYSLATDLFHESLKILRHHKKPRAIVACLHNVGVNYCNLGQFDKAQEYLWESLLEMRGIGYFDYAPIAVANLGHAALGRDDTRRAVQLFAAAEALRQHYPQVWPASASENLALALADLRSKLFPQVFTRLWRKGQRMSLEEVLAFFST